MRQETDGSSEEDAIRYGIRKSEELQCGPSEGIQFRGPFGFEKQIERIENKLKYKLMDKLDHVEGIRKSLRAFGRRRRIKSR